MISSTASPLTIAVDGPAGAGKSTVARAVATALNYMHVDTGAMYRAATLRCLRLHIDVAQPDQVARAIAGFDVRLEPSPHGLSVFLDGEDVTEAIRRADVGDAVSQVAKAPAVRDALVRLQREMGSRGGVVMDGRDIGTVVLPQADLKVYLTASSEERARRRHAEMEARGVNIPYKDVLESIRLRDETDASRSISPLIKATDAVEVDSTGRSAGDVVQEILALCREKGAVTCST